MADPLELITRALAGRYAIERQLGEGGWATVYLALDERHRRMVAVKVLKPELTRTIGIERFGREIEIAARLNHPHILPLLDSGTIELEPGWPAVAYYVMPYVPGESLRHRLDRDGKLPVVEALRIAREVADALDYAHRQGVIHRDIKPENILLSDEHAVVADFGIARALDEAGAGATSGITGVGQPLGTPAYMSPEQVTGDQALDGRTDLYALGCTLYEMLVGRPAWTGGSLTALMARRLSQPAPRIRTIDQTIPQVVDDALARALSVEPAKRFDTPAEFARELERAGGPLTAPISGRRRVLRVLAGLAGALALILITTRLARNTRADGITSLAIAPQPADSAIQYLSDGIQDGVADRLRQLPQLRVTAPSVVEQVRQQEPGMNNEELGKRLRVGAVLTWDLTSTGDSLRVRAELLRVPGADLLWSVRYSRPVSELTMIQGSLARMIADSLRLQLTGSERATLTRAPTASAAAYDLYVRGRKFELQAIPLGASRAQAAHDSMRDYGHRAVQLDSNFAAAHALLGTYYFLGAFRGWKSPFAAYIDSGQTFSRRAMALDSTLGDPWVNVMSHALYFDDDWDAAREASRRAARLSPHDPVVQQFLGIYIGEVEGRLDSAIAMLRRSAAADPSTINLNTLGDLYLRARLNDSAITVLRQAITFDPSVPGPRRRLITALERSGRYADAVTERRALGDSSAALFAQALSQAGPRGYQRVLAADLRDRISSQTRAISEPFQLPRDTVPPTREGRIAALYAQLGEWQSAMDWIVRERARRPRRFRIYVTNPDFFGIQSDPRFTALVREDGLEELVRRVRRER